MDLKTLQDTPSWEWPEGAGQMLTKIFSDVQADASERLLRSRAVISMGPALEYADTDGFDDMDYEGISEGLFNNIQDSLRKLYMDSGVPKEVRRRILEASVRPLRTGTRMPSVLPMPTRMKTGS